MDDLIGGAAGAAVGVALAVAAFVGFLMLVASAVGFLLLVAAIAAVAGGAAWAAARLFERWAATHVLDAPTCPLALERFDGRLRFVPDSGAIGEVAEELNLRFASFAVGAAVASVVATVGASYSASSAWFVLILAVGVASAWLVSGRVSRRTPARLADAHRELFAAPVQQLDVFVRDVYEVDARIRSLARGFAPPFDAAAVLQDVLTTANDRVLYDGDAVKEHLRRVHADASNVLNRLAACLDERARVAETIDHQRRVAVAASDIERVRELDAALAALDASSATRHLTRRRWDEYLSTVARVLETVRSSNGGASRHGARSGGAYGSASRSAGRQDGNKARDRHEASGSPDSQPGSVAWAFDVMALRPPSTREQVRAHYLNLAKQLHPDRFISAPEEVKRVVTRQFQNLNAAYEVLKRHFKAAA